MQHDDVYLRSSCCSSISNISCDCCPTDLMLIVSSNIIPEMIVISVRSAPDLSLIVSSLTLIWNISFRQENVGYLLSVGVLLYLSILFEFPLKYPNLFPTHHEKDELFEGICTILSNINLNGNESHTREVISYHFFPKLIKLLIDGEIKSDKGRKALICSLGNICTMSLFTVEELQSLSRMPCYLESTGTGRSCLLVSFLLKVIQAIHELEESSDSSFSPTSLNRFQYSTACIEMLCKLGVFSNQSEF
jgi:hypothetical protein